MVKSNFKVLLVLIAGITLLLAHTGCSKKEPGLKYSLGTFPDSIINLQNINTIYDDYNFALPILQNKLPIIFSSNRASQGALLVSFGFKGKYFW